MAEEHDSSTPTPDPTERTVEALRRDIGALKDVMNARFDQINLVVTSLENLYDRLLEERDRRYGERFEAAENAVAAAFQSSEQAIAKAETSIEKRADATYVQLSEMQKMLGDLTTRKEVDQRFNDHLERIQSNANRIIEISAAKMGASEQRTGMHESTRMAIAIGGFAILVLTFILARGGL